MFSTGLGGFRAESKDENARTVSAFRALLANVRRYIDTLVTETLAAQVDKPTTRQSTPTLMTTPYIINSKSLPVQGSIGRAWSH